jgi:hypothetical protein
MYVTTAILGESGTGKSASMRNLDPAETLLIQTVRKPLPFKSKNWKLLSTESKDGNVIVSRDHNQILKAALHTRRPVVIIDDFQYLMFGEMMDRSSETGYQKFTDMAAHVWSLITELNQAAGEKRIYFMCHTEATEAGGVRMKTVGKMLHEKLTVEGLFTIVMKTQVFNGHYQFTTRNNGSDPVKTPLGLFEEDVIDNDLASVDAAISAYYGDN